MSGRQGMATTLLDSPAPVKHSAMSLLSSGTDLFSMLGMSKESAPPSADHELDVPSDESYVICAVLDDASRTRVRIGSARFYTSSASVQIMDVWVSERGR